MQPSVLQRAIAGAYGSIYRVYLSYGSNPAFGCTATLSERRHASGISLGLDPSRPSRPYLVISANAAALGPGVGP